jgi:CHAT domain-containing protein/Tfp pilus assembly protein PilF
MRTRGFRVALWLGTLAVLATAALPSPLARAAPPALQPLSPGAAIERPLAGGEAHAYSLVADSAQRLLVTLEQRGIDVALELRDADGRVVLAVDGPTDSEGLESLLLPAAASGALELRVHSPNAGAAPGSYALRLEALAESTPAERQRVEAERLLTEAAVRNREGSADSLRRSAALYDEARVHWQALSERTQEARCALSAGAVYTSLGEPKPALAHFAAALALAVELADQAGEAAAWGGIGLSRTALGDATGAVAAQQSALALELGLGRPLEEGKARNNLGFALHRQGELRAAEASYTRALELFHQVGERGWWEANVLQNLAAVEMGLGEPEAALAADGQVLERQRALGDRRGEARTLNNLGVLHDRQGELGEALAAYSAALAFVKPSGDRLWEAALLHNLGAAHLRLGDFPRALSSLEAALAIRREIGDRPGEASTETAIGNACFRLGEADRALAAGRRAAKVATAAADRRGEMLARLLLGELFLAAGEPATAGAELSRAREIARLLGDRADESTILCRLGAAEVAARQPELAAGLLARAVELAREVKTPVRIVAALTALARVERRLDRLAAARAAVEEALRLIEAQRSAEPDPELRATFLASQHAAFELEIELLMELDRREPDRGQARAAFEASERGRARSLLDLLEEAAVDVREGLDPRLHERERALLLRLRAKEARRDDLLRRPATEERRREAEDDRRAVLEELTQVEAEIRRASPRYADLTQPPPAKSEEIQRLLGADTLLLEVALGEEHSFLWAVDGSGVAGFELPPRARIEAAAREVYRRLSVLAPGEGDLDASASELSHMLLAPVAGRLGAHRLVIVADGALQYLPFGMLPEPHGGDARGALRAPLLARHEIVQTPSASAVVVQRRLARRAPAPGAVAVLADPVFDPQDPRVAARGAPGTKGRAAPDRKAAASSPRSAAGEGPLGRLPWTRREAEAIAAVAPAGRSLVALDFRASRETALSPELARYRIVHFATHGRIDSGTPALSGLILSRVNAAGAPREGFLGLRDIYNLRLGADLVVLSGCETALGREVRGEGLVGLTQGFLYTGARQVVASLWRVEDRATAELMSRFYRGLLLEERSPAAALRAAQLAVRQDRRWRSPYYWSGFVVLGDWAGAERPQ